MLESRMRKRLKDRFEQRYILQPIETPTTAVGVPDIFFRTNNNEGWIELKQVKISTKGNVKVPFRPGQESWIQRYIMRGGLMILLCTLEGGNDDFFYAFKGDKIRDEYTYNEFEDESYWQGPIIGFPF